jgi:nucleoside-diphosphate kinase
MIERSLVLLKPDAVQRGHMGEIITRFERAGLKVVACKLVWVDKPFAKLHYAEHVEKKFYPGLEALITLGPVLAMVIEGVEGIETVRKIVGPTEPKSAPAGTIRGDFAHVSYGYADSKGIGIKNLIHASANKIDAAKEIALWFKPEDIHSYKSVHDVHLLE